MTTINHEALKTAIEKTIEQDKDAVAGALRDVIRQVMAQQITSMNPSALQAIGALDKTPANSAETTDQQ